MVKLCGETGRTTGRACRWNVARQPCRWHGGANPGASLEPGEPSIPSTPSTPATPALEPPGRDLHDLCWWAIEEVIRGRLTTAAAQAINGAARILAGLGDAPQDAVEAARDTALRGRIMHGLPPGTDEQWERAERLYEDEALEEFRRWPLLEGDTSAKAKGDDRFEERCGLIVFDGGGDALVCRDRC